MSATLDVLEITRAAYDSADATCLIDKMFYEEDVLYGGSGEGKFPVLDCHQARSVFLTARIRGAPVACGAIIPLEEDVAEVKRIFVLREWRNRGFARAILAELERRAREFGYDTLRLETGILQLPAIKLYESLGFKKIACWGKYADDPMSVCFEKKIADE